MVDVRSAARIWLALGVAVIASWVVLTLVPWAWINPLLAAKEFAGVVLLKVSSGEGTPDVPRNLASVLGGLGAVCLIGSLLGVLSLARGDLRRLAPLLVPMLVALAVLGLGAVVFDRYGLVLMPTIVLLTAMGWERALAASRRNLRTVAAVALVGCTAFTVRSLAGAERLSGEQDVDSLVREWIVENVPRRLRVAVHDEMNAFLPRTSEQLEECVRRIQSPGAFEERWQLLGFGGSTEAEPFRAVVMNDQIFQAYRCQRELDARVNAGYHLVRYHQDPRFMAVLERDAIADFVAGTAERTKGVDVLVLNRVLDAAGPPTQVFNTRRGVRAIYTHHPLDTVGR